MSDDRLAEKFRALGDPTRMRIFRSLMECCPPGGSSERGGPTASEVCCQVSGSGKINSTISHHLKELRQAGLIDVRRQGRCMICRPKPDGVRDMLSFLLDVE
jgi:ArsR family transcriptional regulator, arsenate/arsenite/antimonite-responsive transcriptional repressor